MLFGTASVWSILRRILLHLTWMKVAHLYVHMNVSISCFGCVKVKLVHFGYITHDIWNYIDILLYKIVFSHDRHLLADLWTSETCVLGSAITHDHSQWPATRHCHKEARTVCIVVEWCGVFAELTSHCSTGHFIMDFIFSIKKVDWFHSFTAQLSFFKTMI